ncbi:hypothetical protein O6H91_Y482100 [Diphasiastrum complanatum]|nr:hypothetical protein O6H91_Y482100 [Diphasiastrum complanatum]
MALQTIAESFHRLAVQLEAGDDAAIEVASFSKACDHVSVLFGCLGIAFKFAERDYVAKVSGCSVISYHCTISLCIFQTLLIYCCLCIDISSCALACCFRVLLSIHLVKHYLVE